MDLSSCDINFAITSQLAALIATLKIMDLSALRTIAKRRHLLQQTENDHSFCATLSKNRTPRFKLDLITHHAKAETAAPVPLVTPHKPNQHPLNFDLIRAIALRLKPHVLWMQQH